MLSRESTLGSKGRKGVALTRRSFRRTSLASVPKSVFWTTPASNLSFCEREPWKTGRARGERSSA